jgi:hypothetical protein
VPNPVILLFINKMGTNTELQIVEQPELVAVVKKSTIELTKAQAHAAAFSPFMIQYHELAAVLSDLDKTNPTAEDAKKAREARLKMVKIRTGSEAIKDERKAIMLIESNLIQDLFNVVKNTCALTEAEFMAIEKHQERIEAERLEKLAESRIALLSPYGEINQFVDLKAMDEETFAKYLSNERLSFETRKQQEEKAEQDRIAAEKQAEADRLAKIEAEKKEQERIKAENEKLRLEAEAKEKELAAERKKQAEAEAERQRLAKIEADKQAKIQAEKDAEIAKLKAEQEAERQRKEKELAKEKARIEAEEADKRAKEKAALLAPDKEKINLLFVQIRDFAFPDVQTDEAKKIVSDVKESFGFLMSAIKEQAKLLK